MFKKKKEASTLHYSVVSLVSERIKKLFIYIKTNPLGKKRKNNNINTITHECKHYRPPRSFTFINIIEFGAI